MQLLTYTDYALRVLLYVGAHPGAPVAAGVIAEAYGVSAAHIAKAAKALTRHGLLQATRGVGGGVQLARAPQSIRVGAVVRLFEEGRGPVECLRPGGPKDCKLSPSCALRGALRRAEQAFYQELDAWTLADLLEQTPRLARLLPTRRAVGAA